MVTSTQSKDRISRPYSFRVLTPKGGNNPNMRVSDLIDADMKEWNYLLIRELFWKGDADLILAIPLSTADGEDFVVWHHTANSKFSVQSTYHVATSLANQSRPGTSIPSSPLWKFIWKANVPGKIRIFSWRLARNKIPTGVNLQDKLMVTMLNRTLMDRISLPPGELLSFALNFLFTYNQVNATPKTIGQRVSSSSWSPLGDGVIKLNFDSAMLTASLKTGIGVVVCDSADACVWSKSVRKGWVPEAESMEAITAREAVLLARRLG
ncbi:UNVERIFIED_CONTAM: hypothetical protein Sradi_1579700 [Sesamum radiatum]|uniref:Reverse transcriptase zinc-binding domain-containing protein n=1 Tax=Sesamum radiatum TaxID=300843 RepID=A0AAW2UA25_SESRA